MICPKCHAQDHRDRFELTRMDDTGKAFICPMCDARVCPKCGGEFHPPGWRIPWAYAGQIKRLFSCDCGNKAYLVVQEE